MSSREGCRLLQIAKSGDVVTLHWQRRLYDTRGNAHPNARSRHNVRQTLCLDMERHCSTVEVADWRRLLDNIARRESVALSVIDIAEKAKQIQQSRTKHLEVELSTVILSF